MAERNRILEHWVPVSDKTIDTETYSTHERTGFYVDAGKRVLDVALCALLLVPTSLLMLLIALVIKAFSRGPVFFRQARPGRYGEPFTILKFRTMEIDAEQRFAALDESAREEFRRFGKVTSDPRITPVGAWLRKWSLDEIPQLFNVLRGDMSLVGPRAYLFSQLGDLGTSTEVILSVRPGITGLWQVSGHNALSQQQRMNLDEEYVRRKSIGFDLLILFKTPLAVLSSDGAY